MQKRGTKENIKQCIFSPSLCLFTHRLLVTVDDVRKKLSQLTELETKYAKDLELRLLQNKLKKVDEDKEREEKIKEINEEFLEKTKKIKKTGELSEHQKRINRIFGR